METFQEVYNATKTMSTREILDRMIEISNDPMTCKSHNGIKKFCMYYVIACHRVDINSIKQIQRLRFIDKSVIDEGISEGWIDESEV